MSQNGALARFLDDITPEWIEEHGKAARERAEKMFSKNVVIEQYMEYYKQILAIMPGERQEGEACV